MKCFADRYRLTATSRLVGSNPNMSDMPAGSTHWRVTLRMRGRQLTVPYSMGPACGGEPEAMDVLDCLCFDASTVEQAPFFEEWAGECGYDPDSRKAERVWKAVGYQTRALRKFLGVLYQEALDGTERL